MEAVYHLPAQQDGKHCQDVRGLALLRIILDESSLRVPSATDQSMLWLTREP